MNFTKNYQNLLAALKVYSDRLDHYTEEQFQRKPSNGGWSLAQVYAHLMTANRLTAKGLEKMLEGKISESNERLKLTAWWVLFRGKIPAGRKAPKVIEERTPVYETKEQAKIQIDELLHSLAHVFEKRDSLNQKMKIKHPRLGMLNASQWMRFMEIHSWHHIRQLDRIANSEN